VSLPDLDFELVTLAKAAKRAKRPEEAPSDISRFSDFSAVTPPKAQGAAAPVRSTWLRTVGDLGEAIHEHCASCQVCRLEFFTSDVAAPFCAQGLPLWRRYREVRRDALEATGQQ
jgi:hypothetical protein